MVSLYLRNSLKIFFCISMSIFVLWAHNICMHLLTLRIYNHKTSYWHLAHTHVTMLDLHSKIKYLCCCWIHDYKFLQKLAWHKFFVCGEKMHGRTCLIFWFLGLSFFLCLSKDCKNQALLFCIFILFMQCSACFEICRCDPFRRHETFWEVTSVL